jgi:hypothetical protein
VEMICPQCDRVFQVPARRARASGLLGTPTCPSCRAPLRRHSLPGRRRLARTSSTRSENRAVGAVLTILALLAGAWCGYLLASGSAEKPLHALMGLVGSAAGVGYGLWVMAKGRFQ